MSHIQSNTFSSARISLNIDTELRGETWFVKSHYGNANSSHQSRHLHKQVGCRREGAADIGVRGARDGRCNRYS